MFLLPPVNCINFRYSKRDYCFYYFNQIKPFVCYLTRKKNASNLDEIYYNKIYIPKVKGNKILIIRIVCANGQEAQKDSVNLDTRKFPENLQIARISAPVLRHTTV